MNNYEKNFKKFLTEGMDIEKVDESSTWEKMRAPFRQYFGDENMSNQDILEALINNEIITLDSLFKLGTDLIDTLIDQYEQEARQAYIDNDEEPLSVDMYESEEVEESENIQENYDDKATEAIQFALDNDERLYNGVRNEQDIQKAMELIKQSIMSREDLMNIVATEILNSADLASIVRDTQE